jgi:hypothetical protein
MRQGETEVDERGIIGAWRGTASINSRGRACPCPNRAQRDGVIASSNSGRNKPLPQRLVITTSSKTYRAPTDIASVERCAFIRYSLDLLL